MRIVKEGNLYVEVHRGKLPTSQEIQQEKSRALSPHQDDIERFQKEKTRDETLGFVVQAGMVAEKIAVLENKTIAEIIRPEAWGYRVISPEEMKIWEVWLPRQYVEDEFRFYSFDQIPQAALDEYETARGLGLFETFTIRTPEEKKVRDPAIFGWFWKIANGELKKVPVLITRWAESLRPFEEIKAIVERGLTLNKTAIVLSFVFGGILYAVGALLLYLIFSPSLSPAAYFPVSLIALVLGMGFLVCGIGSASPSYRWVLNWVLNRYRLPPRR